LSSLEIRKSGVYRGLKIITIVIKEGLLAHIFINIKYQVGKYKLNIEDI